MSRAWLFPILVAGSMAMIVAVLGATITDSGPWYHSLKQPGWTPPDAAYGVAWNAIYAFTALAGVTGWLATLRWRGREWLLGLSRSTVFSTSCGACSSSACTDSIGR